MSDTGRTVAPWLIGLALAGAAHASVAVAVIGRAQPPALPAPEGAFVVELAEIATSRGTEAKDLALGAEASAQDAIAEADPVEAPPPPEEPEPVPEEVPAPEPEPEPEPEPQPVEPPPAPPQEAVAQSTTTHSDAHVLAETDRAREQAVTRRAVDPQQVAAWMRELEMRLQKEKTYPEEARRAKCEGVATVRLSLTAEGAFAGATLVTGSGTAALDAAALDLVERAAPYPAPPTTGANGLLTLLVPVRYALK
jgi:protein TonB